MEQKVDKSDDPRFMKDFEEYEGDTCCIKSGRGGSAAVNAASQKTGNH